MYYLSWNKFLLKELQLVLAFSPQDQKIFPPGKKLHRVATRTFFLFLFSLCFHFPSRDVILGLVHDRVSLLLKVLSLKCIYILLLLLLIQMLSSIIQIFQEIVSYINIEFHRNLFLLLHELQHV